MDPSANGADVIVRYKESDAVNLFAQLASHQVAESNDKIAILLRDVGPLGALSFLNSASRYDRTKERLVNYLGFIREQRIANPYNVRLPPIGSPSSVIDELECSVAPKVDRLLEVLETFQEWCGNLRCVILTRESSSVIALATVLRTLSQRLPEHFQFLRLGFVLEARSSKGVFGQEATPKLDNEDYGDDGSVIEDFRSGKVNVLVMSSVLFEGFVIPPPNLIVQTDEFLDMENHVRCRSQAGAELKTYVILASEASATQVEDGMKVLKIAERIMAHVLRESDKRLNTLSSSRNVGEDSSSSTVVAAKDALENFCARTIIDDSVQLPGLNGFRLQQRDQARLFLAVRVCKRLLDSSEATKYPPIAKRRKAESNLDLVTAIPKEIEKRLGTSPTWTSSVACRRAMSLPLEVTKRPKLPARVTIYVFRTRLHTPLENTRVHHRNSEPGEEDFCLGLLTFFPDCPSNIPEFPISTRNGRESVRVETLSYSILTEQFWSMCTEFHAYVLKKVCRLPHTNYDPSVAPLIVPIRGNAIDPVVLQRLALLQRPNVSTDDARAMESCQIDILSASEWSRASTIPICIHRLNRLLVAEQYRQAIGSARVKNSPKPWPPMVEKTPPLRKPSDLKVSSQELKFMKEVQDSRGPSPADILAALTPPSAQDAICSERYEVLGDSFLKMAVTLHLFSKKELRDAGELTEERTRLAANRELFLLAASKGLHEAVESREFSPTETFRAPGMILSTSEEIAKVNYQQYQYKLCADAVKSLIAVYLKESGPLSAIWFLKYLGLELGNDEDGDFRSLFNLSYCPDVRNDQRLDKSALIKLCDHLEGVQRIICYTFRKPFYLIEAITHPSYTNNRTTRSQGRLAFLGDALIDYLVSSFIFTNRPHLSPGQQTQVKSAIVCNDNLGRIVICTEISKYLLHNSYSLIPSTVKDDHGKEALLVPPKAFGDLLESIIGAVFIDSGLDMARTWDVFRNLITDETLTRSLSSIPQNPISALEEMFPTDCFFGKACVQTNNLVQMTLSVGGRRYSDVSRNQRSAKLALATRALKDLSGDARS